MNSLIEWANIISRDLDAAGFQAEAMEVQHLSQLAADQKRPKGKRDEAVAQLINRCHMKWIGDLYLPQLSQNAWWSPLNKLARAAQQASKIQSRTRNR